LPTTENARERKPPAIRANDTADLLVRAEGWNPVRERDANSLH
jgi:hypothetical protein